MERGGLNELVRSSRFDCEEYNRSDAILVEKSQIRRRVKKLREVSKREGESGRTEKEAATRRAKDSDGKRQTRCRQLVVLCPS